MVINIFREKLITSTFELRLRRSFVCPDLFPDPDAERIIRELGEDISGRAIYRLPYMWINCVIRQNNLAWEITEYLKRHPDATVVELGAGLSCLRRRWATGQIPGTVGIWRM